MRIQPPEQLEKVLVKPVRKMFLGLRRDLVVAILVALSVITSVTSIYFWQKAQSNPNITKNTEITDKEARDLVIKISEFIVLPEGEEPTIATVSDPEKLRNQAFFAKAQKGDKVLIYANAKKAILYNPTSNKVVEVAPINLSEKSLIQSQPGQ